MTATPTDVLPERFATARLVMRKLQAQDASLLFAAYTGEDYAPRFVRWRPHRDVSEAESFVAKCVAAAQERRLFAYVLALTGESEAPIGMLEARPVGTTTLDLGYVLARRRWGQGLMPEAVRAFADIALALPAIWRVQAVCDVENRGSVRTLEKAGFALEGRLERFVTYAELSPQPRACYMFARCRM